MQVMKLFKNILKNKVNVNSYQLLKTVDFSWHNYIKIPVTVIENETVNGYFKFDIDFENKILKNPRIEISKTHKRPYEALERTMLHEMVHYKVFLELTGVEIAAAFDAYNTENTDLFNKILYLENYAHENKWNSYITYINNKYNLKIG